MQLVILDLSSASLPEIAAHYQAPSPSWVRANMVVSQNGKFVGANQSSRDLTSSEDLSLLLLLRALSDVVLVGANTARLENYRQPKKRDEFSFLNREVPTLAVVSASLNFDLSSPLFHGGQHKTIIINAGSTEPNNELLQVAEVIKVPSSEDFGLGLVAALGDMGYSKITCEGGPGLLRDLLNANIVDEYDLTISPVTVDNEADLANVLPDYSRWNLVATAVVDDFKFQRLLRK